MARKREPTTYILHLIKRSVKKCTGNPFFMDSICIFNERAYTGNEKKGDFRPFDFSAEAQKPGRRARSPFWMC